jgi:hypothetical protein
MMGKKEISRREALKKIGQSTSTILIANSFILALTAFPVSAVGEIASTETETGNEPRRLLVRQPGNEKVVVSGGGSILNFNISGGAGRSSVVVYRPAGSRAPFQQLPRAKAVLAQPRLVNISVDVKGIANGLFEFGVLTSGTPDFKTDLKGTETFQARIKNGQLVEMTGPRERLTGVRATCASAGVPGLIPRQF